MKYMSSILTEKEIRKWKPGDRVMICSQTGSGKSHWIKTVLRSHAMSNGLKILLLSNREILKSQNLEEIGDDDTVVIKNYQSIESLFNMGQQLDEILLQFDIICFDEAHYLLSDSSFNHNTDILLNFLKCGHNEKICLFLTATPQCVYWFQSQFDYSYSIPTDYGYIEKVYFYSKNETVENIISQIPKDEKAIFFGSAIDAFEMHMQTPDSSFICSRFNKEFGKKSSKAAVKEIVSTGEFSEKFLFCTKALDNGVNILSRKLVHIFVDLLDPIDLIQCVGRKRILEGDRVILYVKEQTKRDAFLILSKIKSRLSLVEEREETEKYDFLDRYARKTLDTIIQTNGNINQAKLTYWRYMEEFITRAFYTDGKSYKGEIANLLVGCGKVINPSADEIFQRENLASLLNEFSGKKLYKPEQDEFKSLFFNKMFHPKRKIDVRSRGINTINSILEEEELDYFLVSRKDDYKNGRTQYWMISKVV